MPKIHSRDCVYAALPKPNAKKTKESHGRAIERILVLLNGPNPTFSYYLEERLKATPFPVAVRDADAPLNDIDPSGLFVIVCRYIRPRQLFWLFKHRELLAGASLLIDDDIAATVAGKGGSLAYKAYLIGLGVAPLPFLNRILSELWVSTPHLAKTLTRCYALPPVVLPPFPPEDAYTPGTSSKDSDSVAIAFHTTGNHDSEHTFLIPIIRDALALCPNLHFEVAASGRKLERLWRDAGLPPERFRLRSHRSWTQYLSDTKQQPVDILLVPLLQNRINDSRSATKRFDCARMGAAAIFSRGHVYGQPEPGGEILVDNNHQAWLSAILKLAGNAELRRQTANATRDKISTALAETQKTLPFSWDKIVNVENQK